MRKSLITAMLILACTGCGSAYFYHPTPEAYNRSISQWIGFGAAELYADWGYPQATQSIDDNTYLETYYKLNRNTQIRPVKQSAGYYRPFNERWDTIISKYKTQPMPENYNCRTSFIIVNGVIVDYSYKGYGCVE